MNLASTGLAYAAIHTVTLINTSKKREKLRIGAERVSLIFLILHTKE